MRPISFDTSQNNFQVTPTDINRTIKVNLISPGNIYSDINMSKTSNDFGSRMETMNNEKDIYYNEVVYYDGGDVKGYGDSE